MKIEYKNEILCKKLYRFLGIYNAIKRKKRNEKMGKLSGIDGLEVSVCVGSLLVGGVEE